MAVNKLIVTNSDYIIVANYGHQAWLAEKSLPNGGFNRKITYKWSIFQCLITGGYKQLSRQMFIIPNAEIPEMHR